MKKLRQKVQPGSSNNENIAISLESVFDTEKYNFGSISLASSDCEYDMTDEYFSPTEDND